MFWCVTIMYVTYRVSQKYRGSQLSFLKYPTTPIFDYRFWKSKQFYIRGQSDRQRSLFLKATRSKHHAVKYIKFSGSALISTTLGNRARWVLNDLSMLRPPVSLTSSRIVIYRYMLDQHINRFIGHLETCFLYSDDAQSMY